MKFLCPFLVLANEDLRRLLVGSKCCVQRIDMFFGQLYVVLDIIQLKNKDVTQETSCLKSASTSLIVLQYSAVSPLWRPEPELGYWKWALSTLAIILKLIVLTLPLVTHYVSVSISLPYRLVSPKMTSHFTISRSGSLSQFCVRQNPWFNCGEVYT